MPVGLYASNANNNLNSTITINTNSLNSTQATQQLLLTTANSPNDLATQANTQADTKSQIFLNSDTYAHNFYKLAHNDLLSSNGAVNAGLNIGKAKSNGSSPYLHENNFFNDFILTSDDLNNMKLSSTPSNNSMGSVVNTAHGENSGNNASIFGNLNSYGQNLVSETNGDSKSVLIVVLTTPPASSQDQQINNQLISLKKSSIQQQQHEHLADLDKFNQHTHFNMSTNSYIITNKPALAENLTIIKNEANANPFGNSSASNAIQTVKQQQQHQIDIK